MTIDQRFPVRRVNLVEEPTWKEHWDPSDKIGDYANENAHQDFHYMGVDFIEEYVSDLVTWRPRGNKTGKPRKFSPDEIEWIAKQVKKGESILETTRYAILDALTWMYEAAYLPNSGDVADAKDLASNNVLENFRLNLDLWEPVLVRQQARRGPKEWAPRKRLEEHEVLRDLLGHVELEQEEGHYDRFLVFDFRSSQVAMDLLSRSTWSEIDLIYALKVEFQALSDDYIIDFFHYLKKIMADITVMNRTQWKRSWKAMLDSGVAPEARKEIVAALKQMPAESETEEEDES